MTSCQYCDQPATKQITSRNADVTYEGTIVRHNGNGAYGSYRVHVCDMHGDGVMADLKAAGCDIVVFPLRREAAAGGSRAERSSNGSQSSSSRPEEQSPSYREAMRDSGRSHLLR